MTLGNEGGEFDLKQEGPIANLFVRQSLQGPKLFEMHIETREYRRGLLYNKYMSKIYFHVAELDF